MNKIFLPLSAYLLTGLLAQAAPLSAPTAVHTQPNSSAAVLTVLAPGIEPEPAPFEIMAATPAGWQAVQVAGPFDGYVRNGDIDKALRVKAGASIHLKPSADSGVIAIMGEGDKTTITGLHGKWTQINLEKKVIGYVQGATSVTQPAAPVLTDVTPSPVLAPPPASIPTQSYQTTGSHGAILPRLFQGTFATTRHPFTPRRPYDWQIKDAAGVRYAYLDITKLLLTEQIEKYADREVVVYGAPMALPDGKNIVIKVESLRLK
ncbi:MAG: hypothetical protein IT582_02800 [Opitutaceae bacterium]|nr:hypothetical protein [Opitutaceae bacterium]